LFDVERVAAKIRKEIDERTFAMYILRFQKIIE
jgi:hypothetical protein